MSGPVVSVTDVFVAFPGAAGPVMALRGADLHLGPGERLLVSGPNGSGKTTLLRVVTGDQEVLAGHVEVGGEAVHAMTAAARRAWRTRALGTVDQHARRNLLPELDVVDNVALQLRLTGTPVGRARRQARETLARLGLAHLAGAEVTALSGGEAQRVALCAAVAHRPALLLADEPTGELDDAAARDVYALLEAVAADGTGVILVSHDPRSARFVDRAVRLRDGRLAEQWGPGSAEVAQLPDSRGWVRVPVERLPADAGLPAHGYVAQPVPAGLLLQPRGAPATAPPVLPAPLPPVAAHPDGPLLVLAGVAAGYGDLTLLDGLDLTVASGDWVAVRGPSGSGKSTVLALAAGLLDPLAGTVLVGGAGWAGRDRAARAALRRPWTAVAPQRPGLVETMTVAENLALAAGLRASGVPDATLTGTAAALGLDRLLASPAGVLSGGERQRAALARALVSPAPLLLLDEPTSQQDEVSAAQVAAALHEAVAQGRGVVVASHDPALLAPAGTTVTLDRQSPHGVTVSRQRGPGPGRAAGRPGTAR